MEGAGEELGHSVWVAAGLTLKLGCSRERMPLLSPLPNCHGKLQPTPVWKDPLHRAWADLLQSFQSTIHHRL